MRRRFTEAVARACGPHRRSVVIGHAVGFDLAVLSGNAVVQAWHGRARARSTPGSRPARAPGPRRPLARGPCRVAGREVDRRHSALGDALNRGSDVPRPAAAAARIGIRTLAEAERACGALQRRATSSTAPVGPSPTGRRSPRRRPGSDARRQLSLPSSRQRRDEHAGKFAPRDRSPSRCSRMAEERVSSSS